MLACYHGTIGRAHAGPTLSAFMEAHMKSLALVAVTGIALMLGACSNAPGDRVARGALVGGAAGAGIGQLVGGSTEATLAGAAIGAGTGAAVAASSNPRWCTGYDRYGRPYDYRC